MDSPHKKLQRANRNFQALNRALQRFRDSNPYDLAFSVVKEPGGTFGVIKVKVLKSVPDSIGLIVGEMCNNLRSALEHTLWRAHLAMSHAFNEDVHFPICDNPKWFGKASTKHLKGLSSSQRTKFENVQPYVRGNDLLSVLRALNNTDKHRIIPVVAAQGQIQLMELSGIDLVVPPGATAAISVKTDKPIEDGGELWRQEIGDVSEDNLSVKAGFAYSFLFDGIPAIADKRQVVGTLRSIRDEVRYVLDQL